MSTIFLENRRVTDRAGRWSGWLREWECRLAVWTETGRFFRRILLWWYEV